MKRLEIRTIQHIKSKKLFNNICLGGTFDHLHEGHKLLLKMASKFSNNITIGLTTDSLIKYKKYYDQIQSYQERKKRLESFLQYLLNLDRHSYKIDPLNDPFGQAIKILELEALICSSETYRGCIKINQVRKKRGLEPAIIVIIPLILNDSYRKISSTDIREKLLKKTEEAIPY